MNKKTAKRPNPYGLRLSDDLKAELKGKAAESQRSLNAEIIYRLTQSLIKQSI
ncbi:Arc family DNA-binding protein [Aliivibrio logei]|uniref:Arc family DNA-binding protein n=1 Tax=Aliivibrio logei TaxID=688 RepID=UPI0009F56A93|nr:Arc family DNA-binding protein [Aliivibrio logei]